MSHAVPCPVSSGSAQRSCYSAKELEYAHFVHSLCVLGRLLMYTNGRKLFPIKVRKRRGQYGTAKCEVMTDK